MSNLREKYVYLSGKQKDSTIIGEAINMDSFFIESHGVCQQDEFNLALILSVLFDIDLQIKMQKSFLVNRDCGLY